MKYIYEEFVAEDEIVSAEGQGFTINVRFCRDCEYFVPNGVQPDLPLRRGWCRRLSDEEPYGAKYPYYVHVTTNDFCNEDSLLGLENIGAKTFSESINEIY